MGFFSSDRAVAQYAEGALISFLFLPLSFLLLSPREASLTIAHAPPPPTEIWNVEPVVVPPPKR
jgi:hypothetical protein